VRQRANGISATLIPMQRPHSEMLLIPPKFIGIFLIDICWEIEGAEMMQAALTLDNIESNFILASISL
jgi:hypothetical protein